mgnify:CR=1 FL=1|jgi:hypothetical protein
MFQWEHDLLQPIAARNHMPIPLLWLVGCSSVQVHVYVTFFPKKSYQKTLPKRKLPPALIRMGKSCKGVPEMAVKGLQKFDRFFGNEFL